MLRDLATGAERVIYEGRDGGGNRMNAVSVSHDGRSVAFMRNAPAPFANDLTVVPIQGGSARTVFTTGATASVNFIQAISWGVDDASLFMSRGGQIERVPLAGGPAVATGISIKGLGRMQSDASGRRIVYSGGQNLSELWVLSGFLPSASGRESARAPRP